MNKIISFLTFGFLFLIFLTAINFTASSYAFEIDPNVETVSTGPFHDTGSSKRIRFRCVIFLSEVSLDVFIEKIEYGEENCCPKVTKTFQIDPSKLEGDYKLYDVTSMSWIKYNSFSFVGNSTKYIIKNLDSKYEVTRVR